MNEDYTTAPDYLSESDLISLMEKHGIGTDASMATHINNIGERGYVTVESGRRLVPTKIGLSLVLGYQKIDKDLVVPELRSDIERRVDQIAKGKLSIEVVLKETLDIYRIKL
jgi:DNA topoisomerase-3